MKHTTKTSPVSGAASKSAGKKSTALDTKDENKSMHSIDGVAAVVIGNPDSGPKSAMTPATAPLPAPVPPVPPPLAPVEPPIAELPARVEVPSRGAAPSAPPADKSATSPAKPSKPYVPPAFGPQSAAAKAEAARVPERAPDAPKPKPDIDLPPQPPMLFEVAWEVCWQLGGIYTVLRSKAAAMIKRWEERYCLIGPYNPATAAVEFEEAPSEGMIRQALDKLRAMGIPCHYGRWLIAGRPRVILLDYRARFGSLDADKYTEFFRAFTQVCTNRPVLAHFHEWMGGVAVPRIAHERLPVTTVFTTHATLLGRYLASDNPYFYDHLAFFNADAEADKYQILPRHQIEKTAAHASTVFTTVSEVTSLEAEKLLGRTPDAILPNGLNIQRFAALHEFQNLHARYKERIHEFVMGHFFPSYQFDLDKTVYLFTSGRYEYRNKGLDMFIEAMARLNWRLKQIPNAPTVIAFIITRAQVRHINVGVLQSQMQLEDLRSYCETLQEQMGRSLFNAAAAGRMITMKELLTEDAVVRLKRAIHASRRYAQPNIVTHDLADDANDPVLKHLRHRQLFNAADDPVKMVFHPEFVTATSPLIGLDYEQFVRGCHLGIFPSYYEPWGYTPMESVALGVPAVTTDLSGFGAYCERYVPKHREQGITVLKRRDRSFDSSTDELVDQLVAYVQLSRRDRIELRNRTERHAEIFDWNQLGKHYHEAHDLALERTGGKKPGKVEMKVV